MKNMLTSISALPILLSSTLALAGDVTIGYDNNGYPTAEIAFGDRYDTDGGSSFPDSATMIYIEGWSVDGSAEGPFDNSILIGAYANADPASGENTGNFSCIIKRQSKLFSKALNFLVHGSGASKVRVSSGDPLSAAYMIPECRTFRPAGDSTRVAEINLAWAPFWLYELQDVTGAHYQSFRGSLVPFPLSNGVLVRRVEIAEIGPGDTANTSAPAVRISAFDTSIVGQGPVFGSRFECVKPLDSKFSDVYVALSNSPSRHITFGVQNSATSPHCRHLYIMFSTNDLQM